MRIFRAAILILGVLGIASASGQETYPARPLRLIVGFSAGSAGDVTARLVANAMARKLGQPVVVEDKPGASSNIAAEYVARAPKDGYTLFLGTVANATNTAVMRTLGYDFLQDFTPIGLVAIVPVLLVVHPSLGVHSLSELVALARKKPKEILYASTGVGTTPHLAGELLNNRAGIEMVHVPYQGSPQAVTDLLAGRTQLTFASASTVLPHVRNGALVALASATPNRAVIAPDLPTMGELGMPELDASIWFGIMSPAGTPDEVNTKLSQALNHALESDDVIDGLKKQGFETLRGSPHEFRAYVVREVKKWDRAARMAGLKQ